MEIGSLNEAQVVADVRRGSSQAFAEIVDLYEVPILRYLARMTGDGDLARDLAQDTFLQAFRNIRSTNAELSLKAWLYKIATNNALRHHRRRRLLAFLPFGGDDSPEVRDANADPGRTDVRLDIERALLRVPKEQRTAMVLHYVEGLKYREIAEVLSISEEAVRKRVARGSEEFRTAYLPEGGGQRA